jgi:acetyltransferase-like isoleucine patch superfamily enzyme
MIKFLQNFFFGIIETLIRNISGPLGLLLRRIYYKIRLKKCGKNLKVSIGVEIINPGQVEVGDNVWLDDYSLIIAGNHKLTGNKKEIFFTNNNFKLNQGDVKIGNYIHIAPYCILNGFGAGIHIKDDTTLAAGVKVYSASNTYKDKSSENKRKISMSPKSKNYSVVYYKKPVVIGERCFLALNSSVICSELSNDVLVKANSVILRDVASHSVMIGTPAIVEKKDYNIE